MSSISKVESGLLDPNSKIFDILINNPPKWWRKAKDDDELYIDIRKYNEIMIYFRGGRAAGIKYSREKKDLIVTAHPKYLGFTDKSDTNYYKNDKDHTPIYQPCEDWLENRMDELKNNISTYYTGEKKGEETSEKLIQGELIINGRDKYLDSEFSHRYLEGQRLSIRIDLVKIENNRIVFEELKRIRDPRLMNKEMNPEILIQMRQYKDFLDANASELEAYYRVLYRIKVALGLPVPHVQDVDSLVVDTEPQLLIANNYDKTKRIQKREQRINNIEYILKSNNFVYRIEEL